MEEILEQNSNSSHLLPALPGSSNSSKLALLNNVLRELAESGVVEKHCCRVSHEGEGGSNQVLKIDG